VTDELGAQLTYRYKDVHRSAQTIIVLRVAQLRQGHARVGWHHGRPARRQDRTALHAQGPGPRDRVLRRLLRRLGFYVDETLLSLIATGKGTPNVEE
jgi:hypothetical protein